MYILSVILLTFLFVNLSTCQEPEKVLVADYPDAFVLNPELYLFGTITGERPETLMQVRSFWRNQLNPDNSFLVRWDAQTARLILIIWTRDQRNYQTSFKLRPLGAGEHDLMIQMADLNKETNRLRLFIDCQLIGEETTEVPIREALMGRIVVESDEKYKLYSRVDLQEMLEFMDCDPIETIPISTLPVLPDWVRNRNIQKLGGTNVRITSEGDRIRQDTRDNRIPQTDPMFYTLSQSLRDLTQAIRVMQRDMQLQARETRQLHEVLRQCEMCRRQERHLTTGAFTYFEINSL